MFGSTGEPAVRSATDSSTASTTPGCASLAGLRPPFFSDAALGLVLRELPQVFRAMPDRFGITFEQLGDVRDAAMSHLHRFHRGVTSPILLRQRPIKRLHPPLHIHRIAIHRLDLPTD